MRIAVRPNQDADKLVPINTTSTAAQAAVAPKTSFPLLSEAKIARTTAKMKVATEVVMRQVFLDECNVMIIVGPISAIPPKSAIIKRLKTICASFTWAGTGPSKDDPSRALESRLSAKLIKIIIYVPALKQVDILTSSFPMTRMNLENSSHSRNSLVKN
jgi:hypothetical protein